MSAIKLDSTVDSRSPLGKKILRLYAITLLANLPNVI